MDADFRAIKTVYSYYLPEVRQIISDLVRRYPHEVFLRSTLGKGLDDFEQPIIDRLVRFHSADVPHLHEFPHRYSTAGSEEAIREFMTLLTRRGEKQIYTFRGDYEGFQEVAATRGIAAVQVPTSANPRGLKPGYWFISNPSARNGNILLDRVIHDICDAGHKVFYDLSYLGTADPCHIYGLNHPNIVAVAISFSKPYGLFYYRIGFFFGREPVLTLYANKWFKNIFGLMVAERVLDKIDPRALFHKYSRIQQMILLDIERDCGLRLRPSHAFLLAHIPPDFHGQPVKPTPLIAPFRRDNYYRFCLTPYFLEREQN